MTKTKMGACKVRTRDPQIASLFINLLGGTRTDQVLCRFLKEVRVFQIMECFEVLYNCQASMGKIRIRDICS